MEYTYILKCADGTYYTGHTLDLEERLRRHNKDENTYTKYRLPVELIFYAAFSEKYKAIAFEKYLKSGSGRAFAKGICIKHSTTYNPFYRWFFLWRQDLGAETLHTSVWRQKMDHIISISIISDLLIQMKTDCSLQPGQGWSLRPVFPLVSCCLEFYCFI